MAALLLASTADAGQTDFDNRSAVIFAYFAVGNDDNPSGSVTKDQFARQIEEIATGGYTVKPLPEIIDTFTNTKSLPDKTIVLTFDGADKSIIDNALPLLEKNKLPFTVFIPADRIGQPAFLSWEDLRDLKETGLVTFGLHPSSYGRLVNDKSEDIKRQINNSLSVVRKELDVNATLLAYPYGEYNTAYKKIVSAMGLKAAFGQQSGVAYAGDDLYALPRFTLTERYGDIERFIMTANALPLPVTELSPADPYLNTLTPSIGFTVPDSLGAYLKSLSCFSSTNEKPKLEIINNRVEIRMEKPLNEDRPRINCTLPVAGIPGEEPRFRWFGMMYSVPQNLLAKEETGEKKSARATDDNIDYIP